MILQVIDSAIAAKVNRKLQNCLVVLENGLNAKLDFRSVGLHKISDGNWKYNSSPNQYAYYRRESSVDSQRSAQGYDSCNNQLTTLMVIWVRKKNNYVAAHSVSRQNSRISVTYDNHPECSAFCRSG